MLSYQYFSTKWKAGQTTKLMDFSNKNAIIKKQLINKNNMVVSPKMPGFQWDPNILKQAQAKIEKDAQLSASLKNLNEQPRESGLPPSMVERSLRETPVHRGNNVIIIKRNTQEVPEIPKPTEKPSGQKAPVMVSMKGNPNITESFKDLPTPPPPEAFENTPSKPASNPVMYEVPPAPQTKKGNQVQWGMQPPVLPRNE